MKAYTYTLNEVNTFNNILHDYQAISSDGALEKRNLGYDTYKHMGIVLDDLRYRHKTEVETPELAEYFKSFGCTVTQCSDLYVVELPL